MLHILVSANKFFMTRRRVTAGGPDDLCWFAISNVNAVEATSVVMYANILGNDQWRKLAPSCLYDVI